MFKNIKGILSFSLFTVVALSATAQVTTNSPYSQFGLGNLKNSLLPQFRAMGGLSTAIYKPTVYSNLNPANPASYSSMSSSSSIGLVALDIGFTGSFMGLSKTDVSQTSFNGSLSHVAFGFPVTKKSALSFGLLPYSNLGYRFNDPTKLGTLPDGQSNLNQIYSGEGGLSKAYFGYGYKIGDHLSIGANAEYLFGNLQQSRATEYPDDASFLNVKEQNKNSVSGLTASYGVQYFTNIGKTQLTIGYSGSLGNKINATNTNVVTRYRKDAQGNEMAALDTISINEGSKIKITMPYQHNVGIVLQKFNKWLIGVDMRYANWSNYKVDGTNPGLNNSYGVTLGGQITPDVTSVGSYFKLIDYRFGVRYDKTYISMKNTDIKEMGLSFGFGLPLQSNRSALYKINFTTEVGQRGTLDNNLIRERFLNLHLGFTINDRWFQKYKFD